MKEHDLHNRTDTSITAAHGIRSSRGKICRAIVTFLGGLGAGRGATCEMIAKNLKMKIQTISARLVDLHEGKQVAPAPCRMCGDDPKPACVNCHGSGVMKTKTSSGRLAMIWKAGFNPGDAPAVRRKKRGRPARALSQAIGPKAEKILRLMIEDERGDTTCAEVERVLQMRHQTASSALCRLHQQGFTRDTGERRRGSIVWKFTAAGIDRLTQQLKDKAKRVCDAIDADGGAPE